MTKDVLFFFSFFGFHSRRFFAHIRKIPFYWNTYTRTIRVVMIFPTHKMIFQIQPLPTKSEWKTHRKPKRMKMNIERRKKTNIKNKWKKPNRKKAVYTFIHIQHSAVAAAAAAAAYTAYNTRTYTVCVQPCVLGPKHSHYTFIFRSHNVSSLA